MNNLTLVGRICNELKLEETENSKRTYLTVAVNRTFKNANGEYETDFIRCVLWNNIAKNAFEYCHKGDIVSIRGRLQTRNYEDKDGNKKYVMEVVAETLTFISSKKYNEAQEPKIQTPEPNFQPQEDPFASFGSEIELDGSELPF